ncbi:MAG: hypothetical protein IT244_06955, partial [Bacteroidia bacterium]|nr:hypothetical protein [Bacteroidia bacterium]
VSFKAWYYAAAALAVILLAAVALLMNNQNNGISTGETDIAANKNSNFPHQDRIAAAPTDVPTISEKKNETGINLSDETVLDNSEDDKEVVAKNESEPAIYPESMVIASNIPVIPIKIQSELDEVNVMERASVPVKVSGNKGDVRKPTGKADSDGVAETSSNSIDSAFVRQKTQLAVIQNATTNFKLSFISTKDAVPQISIKQNAQNGVSAADVVVYNLPYDNPLIFNLDSRYFLKAGEKYYEINMGKTGKQTVTPVTDTTVLAALEN